MILSDDSFDKKRPIKLRRTFPYMPMSIGIVSEKVCFIFNIQVRLIICNREKRFSLIGKGIRLQDLTNVKLFSYIHNSR
ncbi:hypothetical protein J2S09_001583 [Bacillus fengqiuensis]|nr:hypothetical protein [Bacillus fengqiuensis]